MVHANGLLKTEIMKAITKSIKQFYHKYGREKREQGIKEYNRKRNIDENEPFSSYQKRSSLLK